MKNTKILNTHLNFIIRDNVLDVTQKNPSLVHQSRENHDSMSLMLKSFDTF